MGGRRVALKVLPFAAIAGLQPSIQVIDTDSAGRTNPLAKELTWIKFSRGHRERGAPLARWNGFHRAVP